MFPEVAPGEEFPRKHHDHEGNEEELEQSETPNFRLLCRVGLLRSDLFTASYLFFALLFALEPSLMLGLPALPILSVTLSELHCQ